MINKNHKYTVFVIILCTFLLSACCAHAEETAIVIKSQDLSAYNEVVKGFQDECLKNNITIKSIYDLDGKMKLGQKIVRKVRNEKPDIVLAIGVLAATVLKEEIDEIPIVFCMVINHARFQLTEPNITGISTEIAIEDQLKGYQSILGPFKNMGVIYDPSKTGNIIQSADKKVDDAGINLVKYEIDSSKEVSEAMGSLIGKIDTLWLLPDSTVVTKNSFDFIKTTTLENKIPLLCTSDVFVKAGALAAISSDHKDVGRQAAGLARKILELSTPGSLGIVYPDHFKLSINTDTAKILGLELKVVQEGSKINFYP
ncbi:MAG: ABC transporter substrate-binding protein [Candidatus Brocadiales bacterium]|nr:ABC transporter substrate-binding protein [Candidatus Brocadiales bacterium]